MEDSWLVIFLRYAFDFAFYYPLLMAYVWITGALIYFFKHERGQANYNEPPDLPEFPLVSILVPCYNESENVEDTFDALSDLHYPNYEIVAINDGSADNTAEILDDLAASIPHMRVVHLASNQGKALALKAGALAAKGEFLVCIDGDAILDHYAVTWMMQHFLHSPRVGAITGNPRIRTRTTLIGRIQVGEFSAIIGLIKRAQRTYGRVFTVSGVICAFRRLALQRVGYWSPDTQTEDIDISWRLQLNYWDVRFEPRALAWILMPETLRGLFKQRIRWAVGGGEALKRYFTKIFKWKSRRMWGIYIEYLISVAWAYTMLILVGIWFCRFIGLPLPTSIPGISWIPYLPGVILGFTCLFQFGISMFIDRRYDQGHLRSYLSTVWYPLAYWTLNWLVSVVAFPKAIFFRGGGRRGRWVTTDRGITDEEEGVEAHSKQDGALGRLPSAAGPSSSKNDAAKA